MYKNKNRWKRIGDDDSCEETTNIDVNQVNSYVQQINKSTLKDLIKKVRYVCYQIYQIPAQNVKLTVIN